MISEIRKQELRQARRAQPMTAEQLLRLHARSGWKLRPATLAQDGALLSVWIDADPAHRGQSAARWLAPEEGIENLLCADRQGPLLFLRCVNAMRLDLQFSPGTETRTAQALATGLPWLAGQARERKYRQLIYESKSKSLVRFLEGIGFRGTSSEHVLAL